VITGKRGKPTVSERMIERLIIARNPQEIAPRVFSNLDARFGMVEPMDIASKCKDIAQKVAQAAGSAIAESQSTSTPADAVRASYPWLLGSSPENVIHEAERAATVNDQAVSALMAHLVNHLIICEGLKQIAAQARAEIVEEVEEIPKEFVDFCNKLQVEGVTVTPIARMSKARLKKVAALIQGITGNDVEALHVNAGDGQEVEVSMKTPPFSNENCTELPELGREGETPQSEALQESSRLSADAAEAIVDPDSDPMAATAAALGYVVTERVAVTPAERAILDAPTPPEGIEFKRLGAEPRHAVDLRMMSECGDMAGVEDILMRRWVKDGQPYADDAELAKRWSWELVVMAGLCNPALYPKGRWDGVLLKSPGPSSGRVRQLRLKS
jgi:hypothetical protein